MQALIALLVTPDRDDISLLWLDAWKASRRARHCMPRSAEQMVVWQQRVADLIAAGVADGVFRNDDPPAAATRLMAVVDGLSVHAAMRSPVDYAVVRQLVIDSTERELGLRPGELEPPTTFAPPGFVDSRAPDTPWKWCVGVHKGAGAGVGASGAGRCAS